MILDATCGLKQMWFQKDDQETIYLDMRYGAIQYSEKQFKRRPDYRNRIIKPTIQADNRYLPFKDGMFDMVLFDPPHMITNIESSEIQHTYSVLHPITWAKDMSIAIKELFRILKPKGFFIFKWAENSAALKEALKLFPCEPLFGSNPQYPQHKTWWIVFRKD